MSASPRRCSRPRSPRGSAHGGESRIKAARFPARKTLEEFDFTFQRSVKKQVIEHLGQLDFLHAKENVVAARAARAPARRHLAIALGIRACLAGQRVAVPHRDRMGRACSPTHNARAASRTSSRRLDAYPAAGRATRSATSRSTRRPPT